MKTSGPSPQDSNVPLSTLAWEGPADLKAWIDHLSAKMRDHGWSARGTVQDDWAVVDVDTGEGGFALAAMLPEISGLGPEGSAVRFGLPLSFGVPSGEPISQRPEVFFYIPSNFTLEDLRAVCEGKLSPTEFTELLNFSVRFSMSSPREKFPKSILLMIGSRTSLRDAGDKHFELWTQDSGEVRYHTLKPTSDPFQAAQQANELGYSPTIYRCQSGQLIAFKSTSGGVFI